MFLERCSTTKNKFATPRTTANTNQCNPEHIQEPKDPEAAGTPFSNKK
jgi:hypothetical protein